MDYTNKSEEYIIYWLKNNLDEERFSHTLGTAKKAKELAQKYSLDPQKAYIAGLLHDCAKCFDNEKTMEILKQLDIQECELLNPKTFHAPVSAYIAEKEFGVTNSEILAAIRWHTLGQIDMSNFTKIVFLADKIEPNTRDADYVEKVEKILDEEGLDKAILKCYKMTINSLIERNLKICPITVEIYNKLQS